MRKNGNIYLVGFMGTGKSSVGRLVAKRKKWQFVDLDELIELKERRAIPEIFSKDGEPYFRKVEQKVLKEVSTQEKFVVACGGGIVINKDNIKIMKETGVMVCLSAAIDVILKRVSGYTHRPLLNVPNPKMQVGHLLKLRAPFYAQADKIIDTSNYSIEKVADKVIKFAFLKKVV